MRSGVGHRHSLDMALLWLLHRPAATDLISLGTAICCGCSPKKTKDQKKKIDNKCKEQQKDKHEEVKKGLQNHKIWGRKVRKSRLFLLECV